MPSGTCSIEEFANRLSRTSGFGCSDAQANSRTVSERGQINLCAENMAQGLQLWIPFERVNLLGVPIPSGVENDVYLDSSNRIVYKVNNLMTSGDVLSLLVRLIKHNNIFPQTAYSLVGFTGFGNGSIYPVLKQEYIPDSTYATHGEILDYMEALGFESIGKGAFSNGSITITDLFPRNVLKRESGLIYVIDSDFR